jgi:hypothetical protein
VNAWLRRCVPLGLAGLLAGAAPVAVTAQTTATGPPPGPRVEISIHGGFATGSAAPGGLSETPPAQQTFTMADGVTQTRAVPSWFFGDGAALLNTVLQFRGIVSRIDPLQQGAWPVASRAAGPQIGVTLGHHVKGGVWLEWSVGLGLDPLGFNGAARGRVENTRTSFETALTALANSSPAVAGSAVSSTVDFAPNGRRAIVSGVVSYRGDGPVMRPFVLAGIGVARPLGDPARLTIAGTYRLTTPGQQVVEETDTVRLSYSSSGSLVWIAGGGMMRDLSRTSSYRIEARMLVSTTAVSAQLETDPSRVESPSGGAVILNATTPGIQFSSTGIRPSLSGHPIRAFDAFAGERRALQWVISAAYVRRF